MEPSSSWAPSSTCFTTSAPARPGVGRRWKSSSRPPPASSSSWRSARATRARWPAWPPSLPSATASSERHHA
ncbi:hypothetical protein ZWY2020_008881 [Hordeum vulgare]|nr:hypothetical protein ZWY2020_008881 [Hordeum vulgare]